MVSAELWLVSSCFTIEHIENTGVFSWGKKTKNMHTSCTITRFSSLQPKIKLKDYCVHTLEEIIFLFLRGDGPDLNAVTLLHV